MLAKDGILQGRYRIIRQLGYGGMGAVYEAVDERFGQPVALKEIIVASVNENQNSLIINAFEREAKSLAKARHEAIPYVRDYFSEADKQFLVMELVEGEDLAEMLEKRGKPFPLEDVVKWADQLLDALDYLHNLDPPIIHRDIKPHNLKLSFRRKIKLLDFGIAKSGESKSAITNQTFVGATLDYSPIEQILRVIDATFREFIILKHKEKAEKVLSQYTDTRCDIYALGATFYHLLTNRAPEDATARTLAIWEGKKDPLPNPSQLNPEIPPLISACLLKAMEIERDHRFSSAIEMQRMLQWAIAEGKPQKNENTLPLSQAEHLRIVEEKIPEQNLTPAATNKLVPEIDIKEIEKEFFSSMSSLPTEPLNKPLVDTQPPAEFTIREWGFQPSGNIAKAELTEKVYSEEILPDKNKMIFESFPTLEKADSKNDAKLFRLLPITALGILTISGIGGIMWLSNSDSTSSNKPATKIVISTPTATPAPTVSPNVPPTPAPTPNKPNKIKEKMKTSVPSKPSKTPIQSPIKMPPPTRTPKPPKQIYSDDCIYNRKCG
ncbi:hypothetical protein BH20ACI1_BH20ACI1_08270 [soil metagenome]